MKKNMLLIVLALGMCIPGLSQVPDFSVSGADGSIFKLSEHLGKKILIFDFWSVKCKPCQRLIKELNQLAKERKEDVQLILVSIDPPSQISQADAYVKGKGYDCILLFDTDSRLIRLFNPDQKTPFSMIIDKKGRLAYSHIGFITGQKKEVEKQVELLLNEK